MEGGTKIKVKLDSALDIKSSDMLVSVQEPKLQHNRQKYQGHYLPSSIRFEADGWAIDNEVYNFEFTDDGKVLYKYIDVNSGSLDETVVHAVDKDKEFQFLKQQWCSTMEVEHYWWIDDKHILVLTKDSLVVKRKARYVDGFTGVDIDDWNGDVFIDVDKYPRYLVLNADTADYVGSSVYHSGSMRLVTMGHRDSVIVFNVHNPLDRSTFTFEVPLVKRWLGSKLNIDNQAFYTYSDFNAEMVANDSRFSATVIGNELLIGVHYNKNYGQWCVRVDLTNHTYRIIQGYGMVGVNGTLTGGEIPVDYFDVNIGFNGTVERLAALSDEQDNLADYRDLFTFTERVVGTAEQQWYVKKRISAIVSHITYNVGTQSFNIVALPLNNNYDITYASPSYANYAYFSGGIQVEPLSKLLDGIDGVDDKTRVEVEYKDEVVVPQPGESPGYKPSVDPDEDPDEPKEPETQIVQPISSSGFATFFSIITGCFVFYFRPSIATANYLQQTLGQAAYVHYNHPEIHVSKDKDKTASYYRRIPMNLGVDKDIEYTDPKSYSPLTSDTLSFDRQSVKQVQECDDPFKKSLFLYIAAALISLADVAQEVIAVNRSSNMTTTSDVGRQFGQFFLQNMNSLKASGMMMHALNSTLTSEVTAIKSLDMFYSTTEKQEIHAGRGFVCHNFVAQCVSQSTTSLEAQYLEQSIFYVLEQATYYAMIGVNKVYEAMVKWTKQQYDSVCGPSFTLLGMVNGGTFTSDIFKAIYAVAYYAALGLKAVSDIALEVLPGIVHSLGGGKLQASVSKNLGKSDFEIEGSHRYGSRSETFMYPCFGIDEPLTLTEEEVVCDYQNKSWYLHMGDDTTPAIGLPKHPKNTVTTLPGRYASEFEGSVPYYIAMTKGVTHEVVLPKDMAYVVGTECFLSKTLFKNQNIGESYPVFPTCCYQDYMLDKYWELGTTATYGDDMWLSCRDTKLIEGRYSNIVIYGEEFCGVSSTYTAIEIKKGIDKKYLRPFVATPRALALNVSGMNVCFDRRVYHAFDGYGYRNVSWLGTAAMAKNIYTKQYAFLMNDQFKRSNKLPANEFMGNFTSEPEMAIKGDYNDQVFSQYTQVYHGVGLTAQARAGEDKDAIRASIPIFFETVSVLPAAIRTLESSNLSLEMGITCLVTSIRGGAMEYKPPESVDFTIGKGLFRVTDEYICELVPLEGFAHIYDTITRVPCLGLKFLGSTPYEAYFYSQATRQYYRYSGGTSLQVIDMIERFRNVVGGLYDFVNQEVLVPCLATFLRLDKYVEDDADETDNVIIPRLKDSVFGGEVNPPLDTIYNTRSWFKTISLACGTVYQGPNRCIINRFVYQDYMKEQILSNYGKWKRVPKEKYHPFREYADRYERVDEQIGENLEVKGWTHNPFLLVTAPLGVADETDCLFEWEITFCYPVEMDDLQPVGTYAVVNIQAETMTPGGKVVAARPTHVYLTKDLFTRTGNYGYYSFRYQSKNGVGNRERLHIWSDQYICVSALQLEYKEVTNKRTEILTQQVDVQRLKEI